ncbi:hypothetical protein O0J73_06015 [Stenotrophomonas sp. Sm6012]|uniref:hypothetical protein n=1 Tax=Stenotrophomonas sp. Sm6012 TaxID=3002745 RepID=UPI0027E49EA1|nr:hypothetical protein [Stenotrophomonas sp. Sm6012]MDQ7280289.1 hypothetical protein [Stenotrophomonas sp. Sm6012]
MSLPRECPHCAANAMCCNPAMCYSAMITAAYQKLVRMTGATISLQDFAALYVHDQGKKWPKTPKAMD